MADDLEAELSALEDAAPDTPDTEAAVEYGPGNPKPDAPEAEAKEPEQEEWKPPSKEHWENIQKAQRADREAARQARRQAQLMEQNFQRMEQQIQAFQARQLQQQLQAPPPDPYLEPEAAREWQERRQQDIQRIYQAEMQRQQALQQAAQQEKQFAYLVSEVDNIEAEFKQQHPDYDEATDHILNTQQKLLESMGYPPHVAAEQVAVWSVNVAQQAIAAGRNPAEAAYQLARQMGYQPKGTGAQAAAEKIAAIKAGQASAQTLSGGGAGQRGGTSLKQIASLEGAAFDAAMEKYLSDAIKGR